MKSSVVGIPHLNNEWLKNGNLGLKEIFDEGYNNFASKAINNDKNIARYQTSTAISF